MRTKLVGLIVFGLVFGGLFGSLPPAAAGTPHVVVGDVNDTNPGFPADMANATFYLVNKPAEPAQTQPDIDNHDPLGGTPAFFGWDVGTPWAWAVGDEVVAVVQTIRGMNGWLGSNYTTSTVGSLDSSNVQTLAASTLEPLPALTLVPRPGAVNVTWTGLVDVHANVVDYRVEHSTSPGGPFAFDGRSSPQVAAGPVWYDDQGLAPSVHCYRIKVNYRRDAVGGVYSTVGTSEPACVTLGAAPWITATVPVDFAPSVATSSTIRVTFSEAMNPGTVNWQILPNIPGIVPTWNGLFNELTLTPPPPGLTECTTYNVTISGRDADNGFDLVPGPVPNPWQFTVQCLFPFVAATSPPNNAMGVSVRAHIVIDFSEAMAIATVGYSIFPGVALDGPRWENGDTRLRLTHALEEFAQATLYTFQVTQGEDLDGNPLVGGGAPNPFTFTTNSKPTVSVTLPAASTCSVGGTGLPIEWSGTDDATPPNALVFYVNYTYGATTGYVDGPLTGATTTTWNLPNTLDQTSVRIEVTAVDGAGDTGVGLSGAFTVDSTAPTVTQSTPTQASSTVSRTQVIILVFSERMNTDSVNTSVSIDGGIAISGYTWTNQNQNVAIAHGDFASDSPYTVRLAISAKDACGSNGNPLAAEFTLSFRTEPATPNPPGQPTFSAIGSTSLTVSWTAPTAYTDGLPIASGTLITYQIYRSTGAAQQGTQVGTTSSSAATVTWTDSAVSQATTYYYRVVAVVASVASAPSPQGTVTTPAGGPDIFLWLILLIVIIVAVIVAAVVLARRRKPEAAAPPRREAPPEEVPYEEPAPAEEEGPPAEEEGMPPEDEP